MIKAGKQFEKVQRAGRGSQKGCYFLAPCLLHSRNLEDITKNARDQRSLKSNIE